MLGLFGQRLYFYNKSYCKPVQIRRPRAAAPARRRTARAGMDPHDVRAAQRTCGDGCRRSKDGGAYEDWRGELKYK